MSYFTNFDTIYYDIKGVKGKKQFTEMKNILKRVRMKTGFIQNRVYYSDYNVIDGETPESIAYDFYGDSGLHWIVMYAQQVTNPYYDWPMTYHTLSRYITKKYGAEQLSVHHWEDADGNEVNEPDTLIGNGTTDVYGYANPITNFKYEERENDKRRSINLVRPDYVTAIRKEFEKLLNQ